MRKLKVLVVLVAFLALGAVIAWQQLQAQRLRADAAMLRQQVEQAVALREENQRLAEQGRVAAERARTDASELLRLRGQSVRLRQTEQENTRLRAEHQRLARSMTNSGPATAEDDALNTPEKKLQRAKGFFGRDLGLALIAAAEANGGNVPTELSGPLFDLVERLSAGAEYGLRARHFEMVYTGSLRDVKDGGATVLAREKEPVQLSDGKWMKLYILADGSSQYIAAASRDGFAAREKELWPAASKP